MINNSTHDDSYRPWFRLAAAVVIRALFDLRLQNRHLASEARIWLASDDAAAMMDTLKLSPDLLRDLDVRRLNFNNCRSQRRTRDPSRSTLARWAREDARNGDL